MCTWLIAEIADIALCRTGFVSGLDAAVVRERDLLASQDLAVKAPFFVKIGALIELLQLRSSTGCESKDGQDCKYCEAHIVH